MAVILPPKPAVVNRVLGRFQTQGYRLPHCYHHDPTAMLVQMLLLMFGFALFNAFALHNQLVRVGQVTLKDLAHQLDLALEADLPWNQWFHSG